MSALAQQKQEALKADIIRLNELRRRIKQINPDALAVKYNVGRTRIYYGPRSPEMDRDVTEYRRLLSELGRYRNEVLCERHGVHRHTVAKYKALIFIGDSLPLSREELIA